MTLKSGFGLLFAFALLAFSGAAEGQAKPGVTVTYGLSLVGDLKLPPDFKHFPYANPDAPKGGEVTTAAIGSYDSFNPFIIRGKPAAAAASVYESLMAPSADQPEESYAHIAKSIELPDDHLSVTFNIRPEAHFWDGHPITSEDVIWSFNTLRDQGKPFYKQYYADVDHVEAEGPQRVVFRFKKVNRELAQIVGELPIMPKHWWATRDFSKPLTEPPLGSGPYRITKFDMGRNVTVERVKDYWAQNLPTALGLNNFDTINTEYFRDGTVALEAFKSGQIDWRRENSSKYWATEYTFPAVEKGLVIKETLPEDLPTGMQGFAMNTRRPIFSDRHVRQAMVELFDFEWMNKNLFYGLYARTDSYFSGSEYASSGIPTGDELALLDKYRDKLPPEIFTKPFTLPVTDGSGDNRPGLRRAIGLFKEAGWNVIDRKLVNAKGEQFTFEILLSDAALERVALPYVQVLKRIGMDVRVRTVDPSQYERMTDTFDFDMTDQRIGESDSPGNEQNDFWSCASSRIEGSQNEMGICDPVVDALIGDVVSAPDHPHLVTAVRALDRVLLSGDYIVPQWHLGAVWIAHWNRFSHLDVPVRSGVVLTAWWLDAAKAAVTDPARSMGQ
jgi:microcin C transport system substrate-binding protein